jgi:hypothetical protein
MNVAVPANKLFLAREARPYVSSHRVVSESWWVCLGHIRLVRALWEIFFPELSLEMAARGLAQEIIKNNFGT